MDLSKRRVIGVSVCVAGIGVGLIVAAFATDHWIDSNPYPMNKNNTIINENATSGLDSKYTANITFGLFTGYKSIDYGLSPRQSKLKIACDTAESVCAFIDDQGLYDIPLSDLIQAYKNQTGEGKKSVEWFGLFSFPLYATTLVFLVIAILWGFVAIGFGMFSITGRPIATITGPSGLYLWNFLAFLFTIAAIGVYLGLYFSQLKVNILQKKSLDAGFTSEDLTDLDYSFYLVVGAAAAFLLNEVILSVSGQKCSCSYSRSGEKEVDNGMILY